MRDIIKKAGKNAASIVLILICLTLFIFLYSSEAQVKALSSEATHSDARIESLEKELAESIEENLAAFDEITSYQELVSEKDNEIKSLEESIESLNADILIIKDNLDILSDQPTIEDNFEKIAYLTFDDGPSGNTPIVLNILKRYQIKATFFVVYTKYGDKNDIYNRILAEGHALGNHTYDHIKAFHNWDKYLANMRQMEDFLIEKTGQKTYLLRFPGGTSQNWYGDEECLHQVQRLREMGYQYFDWNVSTSDGGANYVSAEEILEFVAGRSKRQDKIIVLMHDRADKESTVEALPDVIEYLRDKGYVFLPLTTQSFTRQFFDITQEDRLREASTN